MSLVRQFAETLDYTWVLSRALYVVFERRAEVVRGSSAHDWRAALNRYRAAVEALIAVLLPSLRPERAAERAREARGPEELDALLEEVLSSLERSGLLVRQRVLEVGEHAGDV